MSPRLTLKKGSERRQLLGHPWVYDGEIAHLEGSPNDGAVADCYSHKGLFLGRGYFNSQSKIRLRILTRNPEEPVDDTLLRQRLTWALGRRQILYPTGTSLRLVHAEGDGLPGLTVDRYEDVLVMQCSSLGMDQRQATLAMLLQELTGLQHIYVRNDLSTRQNDGLAPSKGCLGVPFPTTLQMVEHGLQFEVDVVEGHKTGFYLDQTDNHLLFRTLIPPGSAVLDAFCYSGAFAVHAAAVGASTVLGLDTSAAALAIAQRNAARNGVSQICHFAEANVFDRLHQLLASDQRFDVVVLDPPSFTHHRQSVAKALSGYKEIHLRALKLLRPGGLLWTFTCSYYVDRVQFEGMLQEAAGDARRQLIIRQRLSQAAHHPEVLNIPETGYLKGLVAEVW